MRDVERNVSVSASFYFGFEGTRTSVVSGPIWSWSRVPTTKCRFACVPQNVLHRCTQPRPQSHPCAKFNGIFDGMVDGMVDGIFNGLFYGCSTERPTDCSTDCSTESSTEGINLERETAWFEASAERLSRRGLFRVRVSFLGTSELARVGVD